jgi:hypothetical protein
VLISGRLYLAMQLPCALFDLGDGGSGRRRSAKRNSGQKQVQLPQGLCVVFVSLRELLETSCYRTD